jgi:hypothetical protein
MKTRLIGCIAMGIVVAACSSADKGAGSANEAAGTQQTDAQFTFLGTVTATSQGGRDVTTPNAFAWGTPYVRVQLRSGCGSSRIDTVSFQSEDQKRGIQGYNFSMFSYGQDTRGNQFFDYVLAGVVDPSTKEVLRPVARPVLNVTVPFFQSQAELEFAGYERTGLFRWEPVYQQGVQYYPAVCYIDVFGIHYVPHVAKPGPTSPANPMPMPKPQLPAGVELPTGPVDRGEEFAFSKENCEQAANDYYGQILSWTTKNVNDMPTRLQIQEHLTGILKDNGLPESHGRCVLVLKFAGEDREASLAQAAYVHYCNEHKIDPYVHKSTILTDDGSERELGIKILLNADIGNNADSMPQQSPAAASSPGDVDSTISIGGGLDVVSPGN